MKTLKILAVVILGSFNAIAQDNSQNYISIHTKVDSLGVNELIDIQYFDGLGRPIQKTLKGYTPTGKDLVTRIEYDYCGREVKNWLPTPFESTTGYINSYNFANGSKQYYMDDRPYSENKYYEGSSYDKLTGQQMPGADMVGQYKHVEKTSNLPNQIKKFIVNNGHLENSGYYDAKTLVCTYTSDEDGKIVCEYKNKQDQVVMQRSASNIDTYYVYNNLGQLCYVIPPIAADNLTAQSVYNDDNDNLKKYCYLYKYDERGNNVVKRLPGCESIFMVYDKADRLLMSQDGNQRAKTPNKWTLNKYDNLGRLLYSTEISLAADHQGLLDYFKNYVVTETFTVGSQSYPMSDTGYSRGWYHAVPCSLLTVNYYDNYDFLQKLPQPMRADLAYAANDGYGRQHPSSIGLLTGTRTYILDGSGAYTTTAIYYDFHGWVVQTRSTNHLNGYDIAYNAYDFTGHVTKNLKTHNITGQNPINELYTNTYDHSGRLLKTKYQINNKPEVTLNDMTEAGAYDEFGRLRKKKRHNGIDAEEFDYNIRNWATRIKSGDFEEKLFYNTNLPENTIPYFNGNIAANTWTYNGQINGYIYYYDKLNRLTSNYSILNGEYQVDYQFSESFVYDKQGNIKQLNRFDNVDVIDQLYLTYDGNQLKNVWDDYASRNQYNIKEYQDKAQNGANTSVEEMKYDANGNLTKDLDRDIVTIKYNLLNLPEIVQFKKGHQIVNKYDASGQKLSTRYVTLDYTLQQPLNPGQILTTGVDVNPDENVSVNGTDYINNIEYKVQRYYDFDVTEAPVDSRTLDMVYNNEGYTKNLTTTYGPVYNYYRKDHLGNNREVWRAAYTKNGTVHAASTDQRTQYYPSGLPWATTTSDHPETQNKKYNGKEFVEMHGYDISDYGARGYHEASGRFTTIDPLAEKYYSISPYAYCAGNPVRYVDVKGEYLVDSNGKRIYENGNWNDKASIGSMRIGNAMQATPTGRSDFNLLVNADYPVTLNLIPGSNDKTNADVQIKEETTKVNDVAVSTKIVGVDINVSEGNAIKKLDQLNNLKAGKITISGQSDSDKARVSNMPQTVDEIIAQKASHEVGHVRQSTAANNGDNKEVYPTKREIENIKETPQFRLEPIPTPVVGIKIN